MSWLRSLVTNEHPIPRELQVQHENHIETIQKAITAVEGFDGSTPVGNRALRELRELEATAKNR